ncbi:MAG: methylmalonyl-CoA mutase family protein [Pseudolabrys sp.]
MADDDQARCRREHAAHDIAVTAAGLGGADSIVALPHTLALGLPDAFARRVARNTQLILLEESIWRKSAIPPPAPAPSKT